MAVNRFIRSVVDETSFRSGLAATDENRAEENAGLASSRRERAADLRIMVNVLLQTETGNIFVERDRFE